MKTVLLVDDESIICQGIEKMISWSEHDLSLLGSACNGAEALVRIKQERPDIVVTDIHMPIMDAIDLIKICFGKKYNPRFIILTGYREFEYANQAMQYGIKHYILKPTEPEELLRALKQERDELNEEEKKKQMVTALHEKLEQVKPQTTERFWSDYIQNGGRTQKDFEYFADPLRKDSMCICIVIDIEGPHDYIEDYALKYLGEEILREVSCGHSTSVDDLCVFILEKTDECGLMEALKKLKSLYAEFYKRSMGISISSLGLCKDVPRLFQEAKDSLSFRFYLEPDIIITQQLIHMVRQKNTEIFSFPFAACEVKISTGSYDTLREQTSYFFNELDKNKVSIEMARSYILQFYLMVTRYLHTGKHMVNISEMQEIMNGDSLIGIREVFRKKVLFYKQTEEDFNRGVKERLVEQLKIIVNENLGNAELNLKWIARNRIYMSEDYLSKIFSQYTGERFAHYVTTLRITKAKRLIEENPGIKIIELSYKTGFDRNSAYFSTVFKGVEGVTPTEYAKQFQPE